ncbi:MAG: T9SS type A sorting domain-containing protein [Ignavibacteria bacterium]|nr:T9SS type A sorting domain-containing protein [Ignavibacteria bacterium]
MKTLLLSKKFFAAVIIIFFASSVLLYGDIDGRTGRTLKTSTSGCSCHGSINSGVTVTIAGPDSLNPGQSSQYTLTVSNAGKTGMGLDIATRLGVLAVVSNTTHLASGEITHNNNISMTNGTATITFSYTAPAAPGTDTLWAVGLAGNSQSNTGGDAWNHAQSKRIIIRNLTGIDPVNSPVSYSISNNYPNPFNPTTKVDVTLLTEKKADIRIFDISGSEVFKIHSGKLGSGSHTFEWNADNNSGITVNSGIYFMKLDIGGTIETRKLMFVK